MFPQKYSVKRHAIIQARNNRDCDNKMIINKPVHGPLSAPATITIIPSGAIPARNKLIGNVAVRYIYWSGGVFHVVFEDVICNDARKNPIYCMNINPADKYKCVRCSCSDAVYPPTSHKEFIATCEKISKKISTRIRSLREVARLSNNEIYFCICKDCQV